MIDFTYKTYDPEIWLIVRDYAREYKIVKISSTSIKYSNILLTLHYIFLHNEYIFANNTFA